MTEEKVTLALMVLIILSLIIMSLVAIYQVRKQTDHKRKWRPYTLKNGQTHWKPNTNQKP